MRAENICWEDFSLFVQCFPMILHKEILNYMAPSHLILNINICMSDVQWVKKKKNKQT